MATQTTLAQIFNLVNSAKAAEITNETAFIAELVAHAGNSQNVRNIGFYLNAMSVKQLGSMAVYREFIGKFTNFSIDFAGADTRVHGNGDVMTAAQIKENPNALDYRTWFTGKLNEAGLTGEAAAVPVSLLYVCKGFKPRPEDAKADAKDAVKANRKEAQAVYDFKRQAWDKFKANEPVDVVIGKDENLVSEDNPKGEIKITVSDYDHSITAFMSRLASLTRSAKLAMTKAKKDDATKIAEAKARIAKELAKIAELDGGKAAVKEFLAEEMRKVLELAPNVFAVYGRTADGRTTIPTICTRTEEGHYVQVQQDDEA